MQRWNGWGDTAVNYPLPDGAAAFLLEMLGHGETSADAAIESVLDRMPESRLGSLAGITTDPVERLLHTHGQSLPDWIALRSGVLGRAPDGIATPESADQIRALLKQAQQKGLRVIPYGGGTSVVGHINPVDSDAPVLTLDLRRMKHLLHLDKVSRLARFEAGAAGPAIEYQLAQHGFTLGHYPQSWEYSTLGGWIATRSTGQQSYHYGRIEDLFAGGSLETPGGTLPLLSLPASAAGPDLRQLVLGSEGRLGVLTEANMRVQPRPERDDFYGIFFRSWEHGFEAARSLVQEGIPVSMVRLSDAQETLTTLALAGKPGLIRLAEGLLRILGAGEERCLMILGVTSDRPTFAQKRAAAFDVVRSCGGLATGTYIGKHWMKSRFRSPYLRNTLWERGFALDTLETAVSWSRLNALRTALLTSLDRVFQTSAVPLLRFSHLSHVYPDGASLYVTLLFPRQVTPEETLAQWRAAKQAACEVIVRHHATISHQHGVGIDHRPFLAFEKGAAGIKALQFISQSFDPQGIMNPGKGWPEPGAG
jgi:alkyldihydroxyacetonephosphate synthase